MTSFVYYTAFFFFFYLFCYPFLSLPPTSPLSVHFFFLFLLLLLVPPSPTPRSFPPSVSVSPFALFPLGRTLTSFVRTITSLTLGIKTWNLCGLIRFGAEFILSLWNAGRKRGKKDRTEKKTEKLVWAHGSIVFFAVCPGGYHESGARALQRMFFL